MAEAFLAQIVSQDQGHSLIETRVISEFQDIFQDIPGLPWMIEVEFCIELQTAAALIFYAPYRMAPVEMRELQTQLEELTAQGVIRKSH